MADNESTKTKIVFSGGAEVTVAGTAEEVERTLSRGSRLDMAHFVDGSGGEVYVSARQVAYVEEVPGTSP